PPCPLRPRKHGAGLSRRGPRSRRWSAACERRERQRGEGAPMSLPPGRPKEGSLPLGGTARSAKGAHSSLPPGRPKEGSLPLGGTARSAKGAHIVVERLTPARRADFLRFFDHQQGAAFADNPEWAKCYCHYYHVPKAIVWNTLDGAANRAAMTARIDVGEMDGFLAYAGEEV